MFDPVAFDGKAILILDNFPHFNHVKKVFEGIGIFDGEEFVLQDSEDNQFPLDPNSIDILPLTAEHKLKFPDSEFYFIH